MSFPQPSPFKKKFKRYYPKKSFPAYRHLPGQTPHPVSDPEGHSYDVHITEELIINELNWKTSSTFLYAIDLFNFAYWWECHEYLESLWLNLEKNSIFKILIQSIIQSAAALIKRFQKNENGEKKLFLNSKMKIDHLLKNKLDFLIGIDLNKLQKDIDCFLNFFPSNRNCQLLIELNY